MLHRRGFLIFISICIYCFARSQSEFPEPQYPMHVIFDTDFGPDYDDVGAITLLHGFADSGLSKYWQPWPVQNIKMQLPPSMFSYVF